MGAWLRINALRPGAFDLPETQTVDLKRLRELVSTALRLKQSENLAPPGRCWDPDPGISPIVQTALADRQAWLAARPPALYSAGRIGSGKELVRAVVFMHLGARPWKPSWPGQLRCHVSLELMESEFFGHKRGSFLPVPVATSPVLFQAASGGTLFSGMRVADLPKAMQVKLLRAIQEKALRPLGPRTGRGGGMSRLAVCPHKDLAAEVAAGVSQGSVLPHQCH